MNDIVTKDKLKQLLDQSDEEKRAKIIGRALVALFNRQTHDEQASNNTHTFNNVGFSGADAKSGSLTAKFFLKHGRLEKWQVERWLKTSKSGYPRICKYASQLNEVALEKAKQTV